MAQVLFHSESRLAGRLSGRCRIILGPINAKRRLPWGPPLHNSEQIRPSVFYLDVRLIIAGSTISDSARKDSPFNSSLPSVAQSSAMIQKRALQKSRKTRLH